MNAENAKIQYESGQNAVAMAALTDQGDHKDFRSADSLWSKKSGYIPNVKPNGLATGGAVSPGVSDDPEKIDVAALTCYLAGVLTSVDASADVTITRPTGGSPANSHNKTSITINSAGVITLVKGTDGTAFSDERGAAGGPAWIPTGSIEIAQVWLSAAASAVITADEIKQVVGVHQERYDYPTWQEKCSNVANRILGNAGIVCDAALPLIHSDDAGTTKAGKKVYASYYEPEFTDVPISSDFVPPENSHSVSSKQVYGGTLGASSASLGQGSFTAYLNDGISDGFIAQRDELLWFKFYQNRNNSLPYIITQGKLGIGRTFPANDQINASCTISAEVPAQDIVG